MTEPTQMYEYRGGVFVPVPSAISECVAQLRDPASEFSQAVKSIVNASGGGGSTGANGVGGFYPPIRYGRKWMDENAPDYAMTTYAGLAISETIDPNGQSFELDIAPKSLSGGNDVDNSARFSLLHSSAVFINDAGQEIDLVENGFVSVTKDSLGKSITVEFKDIISKTSSGTSSYYALDYPWGSPIRVEVVGQLAYNRLWGESGMVSLQAITRYASPPLGWLA